MPRRVVITGIGPITSIGIGKDIFWRSLLNREFSVSPLPAEFERHYAYHSRWYVPLPQVSLIDYGMRFHFESAMQQEDRMAVVGIKLALEDAGFPLEIYERGIRTARRAHDEASRDHPARKASIAAATAAG